MRKEAEVVERECPDCQRKAKAAVREEIRKREKRTRKRERQTLKRKREEVGEVNSSLEGVQRRCEPSYVTS